MIYCIGDLHASLARDWNKESFDKFIKWFTSYPFEKNSTAFFLGDIFDKAMNYGDTLKMASYFFVKCSHLFKDIYIIAGNHDQKMEKNATEFLQYLGGTKYQIKIIDKETILEINNQKILALPHRRVDGKNLDSYYSNDLPEEMYNTEWDLICGHVAAKESHSFFGGIDTSKFKTKHWALGHIHIRYGEFKEYYTGSILPNKINEELGDRDRAIFCFNKGQKTEIKIPKIITYESILFGEVPQYTKESDSLVHVYTVKNCKNKKDAIFHYPNIYIRGVEKAETKIESTTNITNEIFMSPLEALESMIKETKLVLKRKTLALLKNTFGVNLP
jgi:DNA repair exonuclease SbcCD nuclease subunit